MSEMPAGTVLGEGQSWNAQHDYVQTKSSMCDKKALLAEFAASGVTEVRTWIKDQAAKGARVPSYPTFKLWLIGVKTGKTVTAVSAPTVQATTTATPTTIEGMEAAIKQQQEKLEKQKKDYVKLLRNEVTRLKAELGKATQKYEEITEGMSQAELDELHNSDTV
jgi:hypothetical protein